MNKIEKLIKELKESGFYAECSCGGEFKLSDAILFDGTKPFPKEALEIQSDLKSYLREKEDELKKRKKLATDRAEITTKSVNIGKNLEKVLPTMKDFKWNLADCRVMGSPIDFLTFNGFSDGIVQSLSFIEVKSGGARLNKHQKAIRDAIEDKKVSYKVMK